MSLDGMRQMLTVWMHAADESPDGNAPASVGGNISSPSDVRDHDTLPTSTLPSEPQPGGDAMAVQGHEVPFSPAGAFWAVVARVCAIY